MKIKTSALTGVALDYMVAMCKSKLDETTKSISLLGRYTKGGALELTNTTIYSPSTNWSQAGPIIDREKISTEEIQGVWKSEVEFLTADDTQYRYGLGYGSTALLAAMRCYVSSYFGDEVDLPEEFSK